MLGDDAAEAAVTREAARRAAHLDERELYRQQRAGFASTTERPKGASRKKKKKLPRRYVPHYLHGELPGEGAAGLQEADGLPLPDATSSSSGEEEEEEEEERGGGEEGSGASSSEEEREEGMELDGGEGGGAPLGGYSVDSPPPVGDLPRVCGALFALAAQHGFAPRELAERLVCMTADELQSFTAGERSGL